MGLRVRLSFDRLRTNDAGKMPALRIRGSQYADALWQTLIYLSPVEITPPRTMMCGTEGGWMALDRARAQGASEEHELVALLRRQGVSCVLLSSDEDLVALGDGPGDSPDLALIDIAYMTSMEITTCLQACEEAESHTIALVPRSRVPGLDVSLRLTDFIVSPPDPDELVIRAQRALRAGEEAEAESHLIRAGDLQIDTSSYEVTIRGNRVGLRFKEYELLKLLAENPGRVFSRDALLNQIWGYEYFGGTRTVDVHIRRLRSKIEDADHNFIETIWNVGYRFRESD